MKKDNLFSRLLDRQRNYDILFFVFLTLVLIGIYIWVLITSTALDSVWKIVLFTGLMILHISLYWISLPIFAHRRWLAALVIVQGLLIFSIGLLSQTASLTLGLYPGLIGLVIGLPFKRIWRIAAIIFILTLSLVSFLILSGPGAALLWIITTIPVVLFVTLYVTLYMRQADAREKAQALAKELEAANNRLSEYIARVEDLTIANERQRMARELHDTLSQGLAGLILQLEAVEAHLVGNRPERAHAILQQSMARARDTLAEARLAIDDLRQDAQGDLEEVIGQEIDNFTDSTGIPCSREIDLPDNIPEEMSDAILRVTKEGFSNIARHANAHHARMRIVVTHEKHEVEMEISDDGIGFDPGQVAAGHYGLMGMRERVRLAGGSLEINSKPGAGAQIVIRFPLSGESPGEN